MSRGRQWMFSLLSALCVVFAMASGGGQMASAQAGSVGLRLGGGQLTCGEVSARWPSGGNRIETGLGWSREGYHSDMGVSAVYQWYGRFGNGFEWYLGFGLHAAWQTWESGHGDRNGALAALLQAGVEYRFGDSPLSLTFDIRPRRYLQPDSRLLAGDVVLGVRYRL